MAVLDHKRKLAILSDAAEYDAVAADRTDLRQRLAPAPQQLSLY